MPRRTRWVVGASIAVATLVYAWLALARFSTFHNATFDLAFYVRMAWGMVHGEFWDPIVNGHILGLHLSVVLVPLGLLGLLGGLPELLLVVQALALAGAAWPLARMAWRRAGEPAAWAASVAYLLYPTLSHVASYEFHPGSVAVLPMAWLLDAFDDERSLQILWAGVLVVACREDLALVTVMVACAAGFQPSMRRRAVQLGVGSTLWLLLFFSFSIRSSRRPRDR